MAEIFSVFSCGRAHSVARALYGFDPFTKTTLSSSPAARGGKAVKDAGKRNFLRLPLQPRTAHLDSVELRALGVLYLCSFFLIQERTNQESELKGLMPLRNPQNFSLWHICRAWWKNEEKHFP